MNDGLTTGEIGRLTFQELDRRKGFVPCLPDAPLTGPACSEEWYASIYTTPFGELTDDDLSKVSIHGWEPEYFVPLSLERLRVRPFIGAYYGGQLLLNLAGKPVQFWRDRPVLMTDFCRVLDNALHRLTADGEGLMVNEEVFLDEEGIRKLAAVSAVLSCR